MSNSNFIVVSFYTDDYKTEADGLRASLDAFNIPHDIVRINSLGDWTINVNFKSTFCSRMLEKHKKPIVWLDADARIVKYPEMFNTITEDIAFHFHKKELLSGTVFINNTEEAQQLIQRWEWECGDNPKIWDQVSLHKVISDSTNFKLLPAEYCCIKDINPTDNPVITHGQASRRLKHLVNSDKSVHWLSDMINISAFYRKKIIVLGGGPSLKNFDFHKLVERTNDYIVIAVNRGIEYCPNADFWLSIDDRYWSKIYPITVPIKNYYKGILANVIGLADDKPKTSPFININSFEALNLPNKWSTEDAGLVVRHGGHSGQAGLALADLLYPTEIYLLGFDMGQGHFHSGYPFTPQEQWVFDHFRNSMEKIKPLLRCQNVYIHGESALSEQWERKELDLSHIIVSKPYVNFTSAETFELIYSTHKENDMGKLSIVIPTTPNRKSLLKSVCNSLKSQSYPNIEIIVVESLEDEGPSNYDFCDKYANVDSYGMFCKSELINIGIRNASGDMILVHDGDLVPTSHHYLNKIVNNLICHQSVHLGNQVMYLSEVDTEIFQHYGSISCPTFTRVCNYFEGGSIAFRKDELIQWDDRFYNHGSEDTVLFFLLSKCFGLHREKTENFIHLYHDRPNGWNSNHDFNKNIENDIYIMGPEAYLEYIKEKVADRKEREAPLSMDPVTYAKHMSKMYEDIGIEE